jgi:hypothetical protein
MTLCPFIILFKSSGQTWSMWFLIHQIYCGQMAHFRAFTYIFFVKVLLFELFISMFFIMTCGTIMDYKTNFFKHHPFWMVTIMTCGIVYDSLIKTIYQNFEYIWVVHFKWSRLSYMVWKYVFHFLNHLVKASPCANVMMTHGINFTIFKIFAFKNC